jgi:hypothetical protein
VSIAGTAGRFISDPKEEAAKGLLIMCAVNLGNSSIKPRTLAAHDVS